MVSSILHIPNQTVGKTNLKRSINWKEYKQSPTLNRGTNFIRT